MKSENFIIAVLLVVIILVFLVGGFVFIGLINEDVITKEDFDVAMKVQDGKSFGFDDGLTFELFRGGTFEIDGASGYAWQKSESYRDSAIIRSTNPLPPTYKISVVVGGIDYYLENLRGLGPDSEYQEGPLNENGCYLIAITDEKPEYNYTNDWWHKHRKLVIDVDNNVWGHGMPNPIFMVYFDNNNELNAYDHQLERWQRKWEKAVEYQHDEWYKIEIEKTTTHYILSISQEDGTLLKRGNVAINEVWHHEDHYPEYFVIGEPHENYYQGSMKIKSIEILGE